MSDIHIIDRNNAFIVSVKIKLIAYANFINVSLLTLTLIRLRTQETWRHPLSSRNVRWMYHRPVVSKNPPDLSGKISDPNSPHGRR